MTKQQLASAIQVECGFNKVSEYIAYLNQLRLDHIASGTMATAEDYDVFIKIVRRVAQLVK